MAGKSLPMAVFIDHESKVIVITVRGTADWKDIVNDIADHRPCFFDPLGIADANANRKEPFDPDEDLFVPKLWRDIAEDCLFELTDKRILLKARAIAAEKNPESKYRYVVTGHSLGAGVGSLLALFLCKEGSRDNVHFVGFEPPGCVMSKRLALETQRLGWMSSVCAHDFVPRLSIKALQKITNQAISELEICTHSKLQIACLYVGGLLQHSKFLSCCCCPLVNISRWIGGRPIFGNSGAYGSCHENSVVKLSLPRVRSDFLDMCPPGDLMYLKPLASDAQCFGIFQKDVDWCAMWADPEDIQQELILSKRAFELHVPWVYEDAINLMVENLMQDRNTVKRPGSHFSKSRSGGRRPR